MNAANRAIILNGVVIACASVIIAPSFAAQQNKPLASVFR